MRVSTLALVGGQELLYARIRRVMRALGTPEITDQTAINRVYIKDGMIHWYWVIPAKVLVRGGFDSGPKTHTTSLPLATFEKLCEDDD